MAVLAPPRGVMPMQAQKGQVLLPALALLLVVFAGLVALHHTARAVQVKTRLVNAADAAAYTGAVHLARELNVLAYTNRALVANHVLAGHFVSQMSWMRYVERSMRKIRRVAFVSAWVPGIGAAFLRLAELGKTAAVVARTATEAFGAGYIPSVETVNTVLESFQASVALDIRLAHASPVLTGVMRATARTWDPEITLNDPDETSVLVKGVQIAEGVRLATFLESAVPGEDAGRMRDLTLDSLGSSQRWVKGNRGWNLLGLVKKQGNTTLDTGVAPDWRANDRLRLLKDPFFGGWKNLARGSATASAFALDKRYEGIGSYYDLDASERGEDDGVLLTALASGAVNTAVLPAFHGLEIPAQRFKAVARAGVFHRRPLAPSFPGLGGREWPNLLNPFWEARLVTPGIADGLAGGL